MALDRNISPLGHVKMMISDLGTQITSLELERNRFKEDQDRQLAKMNTAVEEAKQRLQAWRDLLEKMNNA